MTTVLTRLRNPPFGTETSERNLMSAAADQIDELCEALERAIGLIEDAERESYWTTCAGDGASATVELNALLAKARGQ